MGNLKISKLRHDVLKSQRALICSLQDLCNQRSCIERKLTPAGKITFKEPDFLAGSDL